MSWRFIRFHARTATVRRMGEALTIRGRRVFDANGVVGQTTLGSADTLTDGQNYTLLHDVVRDALGDVNVVATSLSGEVDVNGIQL